MNLQGTRQLLPALHEFQDFVGLDRDALLKARPEYVIHDVQTFVLGGMQDFQILLDRGFFLVSSRQLIVGHAEASRGIEMLHVFVIDERARLVNQGIDQVPKVDEFLALTEQPRQTL